jgi:hypothetical protein
MINFVYTENGTQYKTSREIQDWKARTFLEHLAAKIETEIEKYECPNHEKDFSLTIEVGTSGLSSGTGVFGAKIISSCCSQFSTLIEAPLFKAQIPKSNS